MAIIQTNVVAYVTQFKEDGTYKAWVWDNLPEGTTHVPKEQYLNSRYYKREGDKFFRWTSTFPCWDYCATVGNIKWQNELKEI